MKRLGIFIAFVFMLAISGMVLAESSDTDTQNTVKEALNVRLEHIQCKVDFTNKQIGLLERYVPDTNISNISRISANKEVLNNDMETLGGYAKSNNKTAFDTYITQAFRPNFQEATQEIMNAKKNFRKYNVSNESRTAFINELKNLTATYSECISDKEIKMGTVMDKHLQNWEKHWTEIIDKMDKNGLNTTKLETLKAEIIAQHDDLQSMLESRNMSNLRKYMGEYRQQHLHYAAQFEVEKLKSYDAKLGEEARKNNMSDWMDKINQSIDKADKYSQTGYKYKEGDFNEVWENIKQANKDMKNVSKEVLKEQRKNAKPMGRQDMPKKGEGK